jgi:hypothetical protein
MPPAPDPSELPAPYRNPWGLLARDLRAVLASLRLKVQELWRRNGAGDLPVAGFWPRSLRPWFWPLLLLLVVLIPGLVLARPGPGGPWRHRAAAPADPVAASESDREAGNEPQTRQGEQAASPPPAVPAEPPPLPDEAPPLRLDPLLALLAEQDPDGVIAAARPQPAQALLELELRDGFITLAAPRRHELAERWLERARSLGYGSLELLDGRGSLLGRSALVGGGMIMLEPSTAG